MSNEPIVTRPLSDNEKLLREKFYGSIAAQSELMDKVAEHLLTLELAIPGLYVTALKLIKGEQAIVPLNTALWLTFAGWLVALILTLMALMPKKWRVDPAILRQDPDNFSEGLGIEDFFEQAAGYKRRLVVASSLLFFCGIFSGIFTLR